MMAESSAATSLMSVHLLSPSVRFQLIRANKTIGEVKIEDDITSVIIKMQD
jgi:hypothetical protein